MVYPSHDTVMSEGELEDLREISKQQDIGKLIANISAHRTEAEVSTLVKLHPLMSTHGKVHHGQPQSWSQLLL
jgi:hypothetical protein